jgi:hypothetical protein
LPFAYRELTFDKSILEIHSGWHDGQALLLDSGSKSLDLTPVKKEFPRARRFMILAAPMRIR